MDRTALAAERTYAAWVRTGLAALASAIGARALLGRPVPSWLVGLTGSALILFAAFCFVAAAWRDGVRVGRPGPDARRVSPWLTTGMSGLLLLASLAVLAAIWIR